MDVIKSQPVAKVIVSPLVLLSVVDHHNRVCKETFKRIVGVLLGSSFRGIVHVSNSYAVPLEEAVINPNIWSLDQHYLEAMFRLFKKIEAKEHVVGWYSTCPTLRQNDPDIHKLFHKYVPNPVLVIIDVRSRERGIPTKAYHDVEEVKEHSVKSRKVFVHVPSEIALDEVNEIGVEQLLRDLKDTTISTLETQVSDKLKALKDFEVSLREINWYLGLVIIKWCPLNHEILYNLQDVFNHRRNFNGSELTKAFIVKTNDMMLLLYLSSLIRCVIALHNLINNKIMYREYEKAEDAKPVEDPADYGIP